MSKPKWSKYTNTTPFDGLSKSRQQALKKHHKDGYWILWIHSVPVRCKTPVWGATLTYRACLEKRD